MGGREVNNSASIRAPCTKYFWRFQRHIGTFLDHLGGVDTPVGRVPAPKTGQVEQIHGGGEVCISASIRAPCTKFCFQVPETHRNISDHLGGVDTPAARGVLVHKNQAKLSKYMGEQGGQYPSFY